MSEKKNCLNYESCIARSSFIKTRVSFEQQKYKYDSKTINLITRRNSIIKRVVSFYASLSLCFVFSWLCYNASKKCIKLMQLHKAFRVGRSSLNISLIFCIGKKSENLKTNGRFTEVFLIKKSHRCCCFKTANNFF